MLRLLLSAALVISSSTAAFANQSFGGPNVTKIVSYTFAHSDGSPYCDGIMLKQVGNKATGVHDGSCMGSPFPYAGGFSAETGEPNGWAITTSIAPGDSDIYVLNEKQLTWSLYEMDSNTSPLTLIVSGRLLVGTPPARIGLISTTSLLEK